MAKVNVTRGQARTQGIVQLCPKNTFVTLDSPGELRKWFLIARKFCTTIWELHNYGKSECHQRTSPNPGNCSTVSKEHVCHIGFTRRAQEMISDCTQVLWQQFENCIIMAKVNVTRGQARTQGIVQLCPKNTFVTLDSPGELRKWFLIARKFCTKIWELHNYGKSECHQRTSPNPGNCSTVSKEHVCHIGFTRRAQEMISDCTQVLRQQFENCIIMAKVNVTRGQARTQGIVQLCPKNTFVTLDSPGELRKWFLIARKFCDNNLRTA